MFAVLLATTYLAATVVFSFVHQRFKCKLFNFSTSSLDFWEPRKCDIKHLNILCKGAFFVR